GGAVVIVGLIGGSFSLPVPMFPLRALTIMGSYVGSLAEARDMLALVQAGKVAPIPVELRPLEATNAALDDLRAGQVVGRVVITPGARRRGEFDANSGNGSGRRRRLLRGPPCRGQA